MPRLPLAALVALAAAAPASAACPTQPTFDPAVPTWASVNGFELGSRAATNAQVTRYIRALDAVSRRVSGGVLGRGSVRGRPLPYVAVSASAHLRGRRLGRIAATMRDLRAARLSRARARRAARSIPAIATVAAGVHGDEPSGTDASMRLLYELTARTDCRNRTRLRRLVTFILPIQNPDGRAAGRRGNARAFDLNRDWFARTQPETAARVAFLRRFPPVVFVDAHEQAGTGYFFPPNADPVHHEISSEALAAINGTFAPALRSAAERHGFDYSNHEPYDLFFMGYGDTASTTAFGAAGMTFEKGADSPYRERTDEQFATQDATLSAAAADKRGLLERWARQWPAAVGQGRAGRLEPNIVVQPSNTVRFPVPPDRVYGYFLRTDVSTGDAARLARRLRAFDVRVYRLTRAARLHGARRYGRGGRGALRVPAGTFWIPMAQAQKHWIQALLGADSHVPFPYFYDVSSWSNPLLMGLEGGAVARPNRRLPARLWRGGSLGRVSGRGPVWRFEDDSTQALGLVFDALRAGARVVRAQKEALVARIPRRRLARLARRRDVVLRRGSLDPPPRHSVDIEAPRVAVLGGLASSDGSSTAFARFVLAERFGVRSTLVSPAQVEAGTLVSRRYTAFVVPAGALASGGLTPAGLTQVQLFVRRGGRYVGLGRTGLAVARASGLTLAGEEPAPPGFQIPGASLRVLVDRSEPLGWGFGDESFAFNLGDPIIRRHPTASSVVSYPDDERFFVSGYAERAEALRGTPAAVSQEVGSGQAVVLAFEPNFRAYTDSTIRLFANAVLHPVAGDGAAGGFRTSVRPSLLAAASSPGPAAVIRVGLGEEPELRAAAAAAGVPAGAQVTRDMRGVSLRVPGARVTDGEEPAWARRVLDRLARMDVRPNLVVL